VRGQARIWAPVDAGRAVEDTHGLPMDLASARSTAQKWTLRIGVGGLLIAVLGIVLYTFATLKFSYSAGERVGYVQKISKRGWLCKTNEGDLAMVNLPGQPAQMFSFTVRDDKVVDQIEALAGHRVALQYEEHRGIPSSCFGDTDYFVVGVQKAE
jgi:hypothetical protein